MTHWNDTDSELVILPTHGGKMAQTDPPDRALQIQAERPVPSGQYLDLKDKENSPGLEAHSMITLWRNQITTLENLPNCSLEGFSRDGESCWGNVGHLSEQ